MLSALKAYLCVELYSSFACYLHLLFIIKFASHAKQKSLKIERCLFCFNFAYSARTRNRNFNINEENTGKDWFILCTMAQVCYGFSDLVCKEVHQLNMASQGPCYSAIPCKHSLTQCFVTHSRITNNIPNSKYKQNYIDLHPVSSSMILMGMTALKIQ